MTCFFTQDTDMVTVDTAGDRPTAILATTDSHKVQSLDSLTPSTTGSTHRPVWSSEANFDQPIEPLSLLF